MLAERVDLFDFSREERKFLKAVCREVESVADELSVYAGSSDDVEHGLLIGNRIVFIDSHTPEINVESIRRKLESIADELKVSSSVRAFPSWRFEAVIAGEKAILEYWCADATKVLPKRMGIYFVKVPLPKEANVGALCEESNLRFALSRVVKGGYFLERECPIQPEKYGFEHVISGEMSGLSIHRAKGNLYRRVL